MTWSTGHAATPDPVSLQVKWTVTGVLFQLLAFGAGLVVAVMVGLIWSILMPRRMTEPTLPARSVACPAAERSVPSVVRRIGAVTPPGDRPERASVATNVTATGVLFQPSGFAPGDWLLVTTGAVSSRFTVTLAVAVFPALSIAVPVTDRL